MSTATLGKLSPSLVLVPHLCAAAIVRLVPGAVQQKVVPTRRREGKIPNLSPGGARPCLAC